jgi:hypothetical protein
MSIRSALALLILVSCSIPALARDWHVAPHGTATGDGTPEEPLTLAAALSSNSPALPGDVILLKGGQYDGALTNNAKGIPARLPFEPKLKGTADKPIVLTSAPGESAHLNGYLLLDGCRYLHFVRLEIGDLQWDPTETKFNHGPGAVWALDSLDIKVMNCNLFGTTQGTGLWRPALGFELYGNLIHDHGIESTTGKPGGRGEGHTAYIQNDQGTKRLEHNIAYRNYGWGIDLYTQGGEVNGFDILENIGYGASELKAGQVGFNFGLTGWKPAERIRFIGNVAYQPRGPEQPWRSNMRLMYHKKPEIVHNDAQVRDNYVMGSCRALALSSWKTIEITGNTFWATEFLTEISSAPAGSGVAENLPKPELAGFLVASNTYIDNGKAKPFIYGAHEKTGDDERLSFADWQKLGLDKGSVMLPGKNGRPTGTRTFVFPNKIEKGRAHVAIFAWDGQPSVAVDLSKALTVGMKYRIFNCHDIRQTLAQATPVLTGAFDGKPIDFPMKHAPASPDFDAFLVLQND